MRTFLGALGVIGILALGTSAASAQGFSVRVGPDYDDDARFERRIVRDFDDDFRPVVRRRVIERRFVEPAPRRRTVCRTVVRERVTPGGFVIRRPTEVCRTVVGARRVFID